MRPECRAPVPTWEAGHGCVCACISLLGREWGQRWEDPWGLLTASLVIRKWQGLGRSAGGWATWCGEDQSSDLQNLCESQGAWTFGQPQQWEARWGGDSAVEGGVGDSSDKVTNETNKSSRRPCFDKMEGSWRRHGTAASGFHRYTQAYLCTQHMQAQCNTHPHTPTHARASTHTRSKESKCTNTHTYSDAHVSESVSQRHKAEIERGRPPSSSGFSRPMHGHPTPVATKV